jgi:hypothetical protein
MRTIVTSCDDANHAMRRAKKEYRGDKECLSMFILLSDTCIKIQINTRLPREITSRYFLKVSASLIPLRRGGVKTPPLYTFEVHVPVRSGQVRGASCGGGVEVLPSDSQLSHSVPLESRLSRRRLRLLSSHQKPDFEIL